ncbi:MAG: MarR family transcriptional regulator [Rhizobiales bacterium]|nr:MarR family transcriptional regulator [Hyphomicrobiales bacterium]
MQSFKYWVCYMNYMSKPVEGVPPSKPHNLKSQLFSASRWMAQSCSNMMSGLGYQMLDYQDFALITVLDNGHITIEDLAARLSWDIAFTSERTNHLETLGFVRIVRAPLNDNQKQIAFTDAGWQLINDLSNVVTQVELLLSQRIGISDVNNIRSIFSSNWGPALKESDLFLNEQFKSDCHSELDI